MSMTRFNHVRSRRRRGFTLLETALAMVIVTVGVVAIIEAQASFVRVNSWSSHEATATYLANEIRERMRVLPRHDPITGLSIAGASVAGWGREAGEDTIEDFNDVDDYAGLVGGNYAMLKFGDVALPASADPVAAVFGGPIDAFGRVIPETDENGVVVVGGGGQPMALRNWCQTVMIEKVDPYDYATVRAPNYIEAAAGAFPGRTVDRYPLRVTVTVWYRDPQENVARDVTSVRWIVSSSK